MPISEAKLLERRRNMLRAARSLLAKVGYDDVTLTGLAEAAGVTTPTLYKAFGDMENLIAEAVLEDFRERMTEAAGEVGGRGLTRLVSLADLFATALTNEPAYVHALIAAFNVAMGDTPVGRTLQAVAMESLTDAIEEIRADGDLEEWVDSAALTRRFVAVQRGANTEWANGTLTDSRQLADATVFTICLMLASVTRGETARQCREIAAERQSRMAREPLAPQFTA